MRYEMTKDEFKIAVRRAFADYKVSEGCSCCQNRTAHEEAEKQLGRLLDVERYDDESGFNFYKYRDAV